MALTPAAMMSLRRGPTMGASPNPGGAPAGPAGPPMGGAPGAGLPGNPAAGDPSSLLVTAIAQKMSEAKKANANFATTHLDQMMRVLGVMQIHVDQMHPGAARHLNRAWAALSAAKKDLTDAAKESAVPARPQLAFSGAGIGPSQANPMGGNGGGGMQGPT